MPTRTLGLALIATLLGLGAAGCGQDDGIEESRIIGDSLTIYSSTPQQGPLARVARDVVRAEKLALREAGGRAGEFNVNYVSLDSSDPDDPDAERWDPGRVAANARRAIQTPNTIAYLGELEPGASAISLPIINEAGILQVSPRDTFGGLTERGGRGEPEKYYPTGVVNFARVVPPADRQARMIVDALAEQEAERVIVADDRRLAGARLGDRIARLAERAGIEVVDRLRLDTRGDVPESLGEDVADERADAFVYLGAYSEFAVDLLRDVHEADPRVDLYGSDELALAPALPRRAGAAAGRLELTDLDPAESAEFERRFEEAYGAEPERHAVLGYRAMRLVLDAIEASGPDAASRREVVRRAVGLAGAPRATFQRYRIDGGRLVTSGPPL